MLKFREGFRNYMLQGGGAGGEKWGKDFDGDIKRKGKDSRISACQLTKPANSLDQILG